MEKQDHVPNITDCSFWAYLVDNLKELGDNNFKAGKIYDYIMKIFAKGELFADQERYI